MKAKNNSEILRRYLFFLGHFTLLLTVTVVCRYFFLRTESQYIHLMQAKQKEVDFFHQQSKLLSDKVDRITSYLAMLHTEQVKNEDALEQSIVKLKDEALHDIKELEREGITDYQLYKKILSDVDKALEAKHTLQQSKEEEALNKKSLLECTRANQQLKSR